MLKQPKKYYRYYLATSDRRRKAGFHREIALSCSDEHRPLIRGKRGKRALYFYSDFSYDREAEPWPDQRSWKHRCKKRHQWVKHHYSLHEQAFLFVRRCREHRAHELMKYLRKEPNWIRLAVQDDPVLEGAIRYLDLKHQIEVKRYGCYESDPTVVDIRLKREDKIGQKTALMADEIAEESAFREANEKRQKHQNKRLPISHKYIRDKYHSLASSRKP